MNVTAYDMAQRFVGMKEVPGKVANPQILAMLQLDQEWPEGDEVPWCSAFANFICWLIRLPRSKSLMARSWLDVAVPMHMEDARVGYDVVVLKRGGGAQPGPQVLDAPGHVGFYAGRLGSDVLILGGNQADSVNMAQYQHERVLGVRRLYQGG